MGDPGQIQCWDFMRGGAKYNSGHQFFHYVSFPNLQFVGSSSHIPGLHDIHVLLGSSSLKPYAYKPYLVMYITVCRAKNKRSYRLPKPLLQRCMLFQGFYIFKVGIRMGVETSLLCLFYAICCSAQTFDLYSACSCKRFVLKT